MNKLSVIAGLTLVLAACQPKQRAANEADTMQENSKTFPENPGAQISDSVQTLLDTTKVEIDSTLLPGKWMQPVPGLDSLTQGIEFRKNGKAMSINMHTLLYDKWKLSHDTLELWSHSDGVSKRGATIDTLLVRELSDSVMVLFPITAAPGYLERYTRQKRKN